MPRTPRELSILSLLSAVVMALIWAVWLLLVCHGNIDHVTQQKRVKTRTNRHLLLVLVTTLVYMVQSVGSLTANGSCMARFSPGFASCNVLYCILLSGALLDLLQFLFQGDTLFQEFIAVFIEPVGKHVEFICLFFVVASLGQFQGLPVFEEALAGFVLTSLPGKVEHLLFFLGSRRHV